MPESANVPALVVSFLLPLAGGTWLFWRAGRPLSFAAMRGLWMTVYAVIPVMLFAFLAAGAKQFTGFNVFPLAPVVVLLFFAWVSTFRPADHKDQKTEISALNEEIAVAAASHTRAIPEVDGKQFAFQAGRIYAKPAFALVATALLFFVASVLSEFGSREILVILAILLSLPVLFLYPLLTPRNGARPTRSLLGMGIGLGAFVAYGLGCYLTFYEGVWGLAQLFWDFSVSSLLWSLTNCVLGFTIVNGMYRLTELCRAVDEGRIIVRR
jgi:hypothetical protein